MQAKFIEIRIMDVVQGTSTNTDGLALYVALDKQLAIGQKVRLSLLDATPFSSSFLNSSFGNLFEKHGMAILRSSLVLTNYTAAQVRKIREYVEIIAA